MKIKREEVLKKLDISDEILSGYENQLEIEISPESSSLESFTEEDLKSIEILHKLRESGLTYNEIKLLVSLADILKNVDISSGSEIKNLLYLSPLYKLKQSLNLARQELNSLKEKAKELEDALKKEIEAKASAGTETIAGLKTEIEAKQKIINSLDLKLSEALVAKAHLESELQAFKDRKLSSGQIKGKKAKELYQIIVQKESELLEVKKSNEGLLAELEQMKEDNIELQERISLMEDETLEMEQEVEERYQEQITSLKDQIEGLIDKKQKEWDAYYAELNDQRKKEILTLQRKHEQEILRLKQKIKMQIEEINELKTYRNPLLALSKIASKLR